MLDNYNLFKRNIVYVTQTYKFARGDWLWLIYFRIINNDSKIWKQNCLWSVIMTEPRMKINVMGGFKDKLGPPNLGQGKLIKLHNYIFSWHIGTRIILFP